MNLKFIFFLFLLSVFPYLGFPQKLPTDILESHCICGIKCPKEMYPKYLKKTSKDLKEIGFRIDEYYYISENPTIRKEQLEKKQNDLSEKDSKHKYVINIGTDFISLRNSEMFFFSISNPHDKSLYLYDPYSIKLWKSNKNLIKSINKKAVKLKNSKNVKK